MNRRLWLTGCLVAAGLAACRSLPKPALVGRAYTGRLSIQVDASALESARTLSTHFELQGTPSTGQLNFSTPLGSIVAQASWSPQQAQLRSQNTEKIFANLDALTQEMIGERLPIAALFDWLQGRPWPQAPHQNLVQAAGFEQLDWTVDTSRIAQGWLTAQRQKAPSMRVKVRLDV